MVPVYPCWTCHRDGINAILREVDKYFLQMKDHRKSRLCARSAVISPMIQYVLSGSAVSTHSPDSQSRFALSIVVHSTVLMRNPLIG
ncbi:unnamed protein product [Dicrocoelium dendriticum]|nr:unnamed protein product [Dicrocoelium dendriticum]